MATKKTIPDEQAASDSSTPETDEPIAQATSFDSGYTLEWLQASGLRFCDRCLSPFQNSPDREPVCPANLTDCPRK